jgi:hypothetical protein
MYSTMMDLNNKLSLGLGIVARYVDTSTMQNLKKYIIWWAIVGFE